MKGYGLGYNSRESRPILKSIFLGLQELFRRVIPHQCLGAVWSRRDKSRDRDAASVVATVEQFNAVSYRVISTILIALDTKPQHRAKVISKWIDIAQVKVSIFAIKHFESKVIKVDFCIFGVKIQ